MTASDINQFAYSSVRSIQSTNNTTTSEMNISTTSQQIPTQQPQNSNNSSFIGNRFRSSSALTSTKQSAKNSPIPPPRLHTLEQNHNLILTQPQQQQLQQSNSVQNFTIHTTSTSQDENQYENTSELNKLTSSTGLMSTFKDSKGNLIEFNTIIRL